MHNELTNLLPQERQREFSRDYLIRLATVAAIMLTALILAATVLLIPSFVFLVKNESAKADQLANIESTLSSVDGQNISARLAALSNSAATLVALGKEHPVSSIVREMLAVSSPGISLSGFSYAPAGAGVKSGTLIISGTAMTRDALRSYQLALQGASFALSADLPVSAYAKDSQIAFTITVTLAP